MMRPSNLSSLVIRKKSSYQPFKNILNFNRKLKYIHSSNNFLFIFRMDFLVLDHPTFKISLKLLITRKIIC